MGFSFAARSTHTNRGCTAVERYFAAIRGVCVAGFVFLQRVEKRIIAVDCSFYARLSACNPATSVCQCVFERMWWCARHAGRRACAESGGGGDGGVGHVVVAGLKSQTPVRPIAIYIIYAK